MTVEYYGRYEVKAQIGQGGMAAVYLAHDPRFGRDVALKVMSTALRDDPGFRGRFEREARTIAGLEHPAIVPVYDFGEEHDQLYLVMRYMPGGSLADRLIARPLTLNEIVPIFQRIGAALDHAHQVGVIHRDLKPGNILFDQYNNAFLSDFGIVKITQESLDLTGSGVIGTPAYMSPEQIHGEKLLDGRSDIYTLGIILFESLTGRKPYRAETPVKQMMAHVLDPVPSILEANPQLPPDCEMVVQKALAKERDSRFASAAELTDALSVTLTFHQPLPDSLAETTDLPTVTAVEMPVSPASSIPVPQSQPPARILISPPPPREEPATFVGTAALTFEKPPPPPPPQPAQPPPPAPMTPASPAKKGRPWLFVGLFVALLLIMLGGYVVVENWPETAVTPSPPAVISFLATATASATHPPPPSAEPATRQPSATPPQTPIWPTPAVTEFGLSALGTPLAAHQFGDGEKVVLLVGGLHAGFAPGSVELAQEAMAYFSEHSEKIPANIALIILPNVNPDSAPAPGQLAGRLNGNGVDLNRNWDCRWVAAPLWGGAAQPGLGGTAPFSEPEVQAFVDLVAARQPKAVVFWQGRAALGLSSPGACEDESLVSRPLAQVYGDAASYKVADFEELVNQEVNGDVTNWLDSQAIPAISILLPDYRTSDFSNNLPAILAVLEMVAAESE